MIRRKFYETISKLNPAIDSELFTVTLNSLCMDHEFEISKLEDKLSETKMLFESLETALSEFLKNEDPISRLALELVLAKFKKSV